MSQFNTVRCREIIMELRVFDEDRQFRLDMTDCSYDADEKLNALGPIKALRLTLEVS